MTLGEQIRSARERKGLSQEGLAEHLGVSRQAVSKWENDSAAPHGTNRTALIEVLDLDIEPSEAMPQTHGRTLWLGWIVAAVLLAALIGILIRQPAAKEDNAAASLVGSLSELQSHPMEAGPPETHENMPELFSIRFYSDTQEEVSSTDPYLRAYNMALVDSILLQWTGDAALESVKVFYTPIGEKTELANEFGGPPDGSHALLLPADALYYKNNADVYFELSFDGNYMVTSEPIRIFFEDNIEFYAFPNELNGQLLTCDKVEWIDFVSEEGLARAEALGLEDPGSGFCIYNEHNATAQYLIAEDCTYTLLDQNANFAPVAVSASEFRDSLAEHTSSHSLYVLTLRDNKIVALQEKYVP